MKNKNSDNNENLRVSRQGSISVKPLKRKVSTVSMYVHELINIKKDIKRGVPISWGLRLFWSVFCLCLGNIVSAATSQENFSMYNYILNSNTVFQVVLVVSLSGSLLLFFLGKSNGSALEGIDQVLKQAGCDPNE